MPQSVSRVRVTVGTETYIFDRNALELTDLYAIKSASGLDANPFLQGILTGDPVALQTLVWFLRHKAGIQGDRLAINFKMGDFDIAAVEDEADPTVASSEPSETATSDASPTSAI